MPRFQKTERLCRRKLIDRLFEKGQVFFCYPFRVVYLLHEAEFTPARVLISVPARRVRRAVDRNRVKRCMREAYRKNKAPFYALLQKQQKHCLLAMLYTSDKVLGQEEIEKKIQLSLNMLMQRISTDDKAGEALI